MMSYVHEIQTVYNVVQNPQMVLLSKKGAHGVSVRREKVCMLLPQRSQGSTFESVTAQALQGGEQRQAVSNSRVWSQQPLC